MSQGDFIRSADFSREVELAVASRLRELGLDPIELERRHMQQLQMADDLEELDRKIKAVEAAALRGASRLVGTLVGFIVLLCAALLALARRVSQGG